MVEDGEKAPDFALDGDDGVTVKLSTLKGNPVVLYFYPKDDTSGCTSEAKDFSALATQFSKAGVRVIGISPDPVASKVKFRKKHGLKVGLLADPDKTAVAAYGVWVEKSMYGRKYMGVERSTFLIDGAGKVAQVWRKVKVPGHADEVLAAVTALKGGAAKTGTAAKAGKLAKANPAAKASKAVKSSSNVSKVSKASKASKARNA